MRAWEAEVVLPCPASKRGDGMHPVEKLCADAVDGCNAAAGMRKGDWRAHCPPMIQPLLPPAPGAGAPWWRREQKGPRPCSGRCTSRKAAWAPSSPCELGWLCMVGRWLLPSPLLVGAGAGWLPSSTPCPTHTPGASVTSGAHPALPTAPPRSFFRSCAYVRSVAGRMQQEQQHAAAAGQQASYPPPAMAAGADPPSMPPQQMLQTALVDPSGKHCCRLGRQPFLAGAAPAAARQVSLRCPLCSRHCNHAGAPWPCFKSGWLATPHPAPARLLHPVRPHPADPTKVYLTQPLDSSQQRQDSPKFPAPLV